MTGPVLRDTTKETFYQGLVRTSHRTVRLLERLIGEYCITKRWLFIVRIIPSTQKKYGRNMDLLVLNWRCE